MKKIQPKKTYTENINRAIDYIEKHLSEEITLEKLAEVACYSPFHFHRIFEAETGETPRNFIERNKLEKAAALLYHNRHKSISEIADACGFSSISTFSRAFKKFFGVSPGAYLAKHISDFHSNEPHSFNHHNTINRDTCSFVKFEKIPAIHVAFCQTLDGYETGVPKAWKKLIAVAIMKGWLNEKTRFIGIPYNNPQITPHEKCRYRACITVGEDINITKGHIKTANLEKGSYALFHFKGKKENIPDAYTFIYGEWLPQSGYVPGNTPLLELYPKKFHRQKKDEMFEYDIALPVNPDETY